MSGNINFIGNRSKFAVLSLTLVVLSLVTISIRGINKSVDFAGGTQITVKFASDHVDTALLRDKVSEVDKKAAIIRLKTDTGAEFTVKIKNPDVQKGEETKASAERRHGLESAFAAVNHEDQEMIDLLNNVQQDTLVRALVVENPFNISDTDAAIEQACREVAQRIKAEVPNANSLGQLTQAVEPERAQALETGLNLAFPAINRTTPDLLAALLKRYDPLNRSLNADYHDVSRQIIAYRTEMNDFIEDINGLANQLQLNENEDPAALMSFLKDHFLLGHYNITANETFSPSIASELLTRAWEAIILAIFGILVYISLRFTLGYAVASVTALVHDVIITLGFFSLAQYELSNPVVAAFLTIVGYSLNDTIVVFDRIRENLRVAGKPDIPIVMNASINETLSRTLVTSLTTLVVVLVIYVFASASLRDFAFPLLVGIVVGTYSSIFVASPVLFLWHQRLRSIVT